MEKLYQLWQQHQDVFREKNKIFQEVAQDFSQTFLDYKLSSGELILDDLEPLSYKLIEQHPKAAIAFSHQWDYWLVDEYQDVSPIQVKLMEKLRQNKPFFVVGDPQQSIYSFRGARSQVFEKTKAQFKKKGWPIKNLKKNYRSHPELVSFFNFIFPSINQAQFRPMEAVVPVKASSPHSKVPLFFYLDTSPSKSSSDAITESHTSEANNKKEQEGIESKANRKGMENAEMMESMKSTENRKGTKSMENTESMESKRNVKDSPQEVFAILSRIQELLTGKNPTKPSEIVVLARTHQQIMSIAREAHKLGIPVQSVGSQSFYESREVQDALALLKFLLNPHDDLNLLQLLRSPTLRLKDNEILHMTPSSNSNGSPSFCYWQQMQNQYGDKKLPPTHPFSRLKWILSLRETEKLSKIFIQSLVEFNMLDICAIQDLTGKREAHLWKLVCELLTLERAPNFDYLDFIAGHQQTNEQDTDSSDSLVGVTQSHRVQLMTIHTAKGLEFEHVIFPFLSEPKRGGGFSKIPFFYHQHKWSLKWRITQGEEEKLTLCPFGYEVEAHKKRTEQEEEKRLMYVACTRAQKTLTLTFTDPAKYKAHLFKKTPELREGRNPYKKKLCLQSLP